MRADSVFVRGLEFEANHGYTAAERKATRRFRVNIELTVPLERASKSDRLADTIDYRRVCELALNAATETTFKLLEALAGAIGHAVQAEFGHAELTIELEKLAPPCPGVPASCGVVVSLPAAPQQRG